MRTQWTGGQSLQMRKEEKEEGRLLQADSRPESLLWPLISQTASRNYLLSPLALGRACGHIPEAGQRPLRAGANQP